MDMGKHTGLALYKGPTRKQTKAREDRAERKVITSVRSQAIEAADCCCERCGQWTGTWGHAHHIVPRSRGGLWTVENIRYVCHNCHAEIHKEGCRS